MADQCIEHLKRTWLADPCWDIEDTEGFEGQREMLLEFRQQHEAKHIAAQREKSLTKAAEVGLPGNVLIGGYLLHLEARIAHLTRRVQEMEQS